MVAAEVVAGQPRPRHAWSRRAVSDSLRLASLAATRQSRAVEALMWLESAVEIDPENGRAWHNLGVSYLRDRRAVEAIVALDRAVLLRPFDSRAWRNLGLAAREAGRPDRSATAFERALSTARNEHQRERALQLRGEK